MVRKPGKHSLKVPAIARLQNAFIAALNKYAHMPKYIIVVPDKDILESIEIYDNGIKKAIFDNLHWLLIQFGHNLITRREDLRAKNTGATPPFFTKVIWVQMLARPISEDPKLARIWKLHRKFNDVLDNLCEIEEYMHVLPIREMEEFKFFDERDNLTPAGEKHYWLHLNDQIKAFEYNNTDHRPTTTKPRSALNQHTAHRNTSNDHRDHRSPMRRRDRKDRKHHKRDRRSSGDYSRHREH